MNNKGFAITTILYGTFLLFMMLLLAMLGILASYKNKMNILLEENNGARDIVDVNGVNSYLMTIDGQKYYKSCDGAAIVAYVYNGKSTGPLLVSTKSNAVSYYTSSKNSYKVIPAGGKVEHNGAYYYYSSSSYWIDGNKTAISPYNWSRIVVSGDNYLEEAVKKLLNDKVNYTADNDNANDACVKIEDMEDGYYY